MADATIDSLKLEISSSSDGASKGLGALTKSLKKLQAATSRGLGLTAVVNELKTANTGISSSLDGFDKAVGILKNLGGVKISSSIGNQVKSISDALKNADFSGGATKMQSLVDALEPLGKLGKSNLSSYVTQLKKLPDVMTELNKLDMNAVKSKFQELATAIKPLGDEMQKVANGFSAFPAKIQKLITSTNKLSTANNKASGSYTNLYHKLKMAWTAVKGVARTISKWITLSSNYTETMNLFTVSMGQYAEEAYNYAQTVSDAMGIDPAEWLRNQGIFMTLAKGFGVAGDRANTMSQQLTQLGYDLSSFFNISVGDAMTKLQSGISGELEPLRRLGYDLSQAKLEATALSLGIDKAVSSMTQAEKAELRYYAIMTQVTDAHGDMARTLNAPANQLRILNAQVTQLCRSLGNFFIPLLNKVLPGIIASVKVLREVLDVFMDLLGIELADVDFGKGSITSATDDIVSNLEDGQTEAKKLKSYMLGFDELNVLNADDGSDGLGNLLGTGFDFELPTYDFMDGIVATQVDEIVQKMKEWLGLTEPINSWADFFDTRLGNILETVGLIGAGITAWKITKGISNFITKDLPVIQKLVKSNGFVITLGLTLAVTGFTMEFNGLKSAVENGLDGFNFAEIVSGALLGGGGAAILGSKIVTWIGKVGSTKVVFALAEMGKNLGVTTTGALGAALGAGIAGIVAGIPAYFVGIYDACTKGIDWLSSLLIGAGATAAGAGIGTIIGMLGGPIGAGIGALIGLAVGLVTDLVILIVQKWDVITDWCKNACSKIGQFFVGLWDGIVGVWNAVANWFNTWVISPIVNFFTGMWNGIKDLAKSCWDGIIAFFSPAITWFATLFNSVKQTISDVFYNIGVIVKGCWLIIKTAWGIASTWFNEKVITPVKNFFTSLWNGVKEKASSVWSSIKSTFSAVANWFNEKVVTPVKNAFSGIWSKLKEGAKSAWSGIKSVFNSVATFFKDIFAKAWESVKKVFSVGGKIFDGIKDGIVSAFKTVVNAIIKGINKVVSVPFNGINSAIEKIRDIEIFNFQPFEGLKTINVPQIPLLAQGGFPEMGQMFIAREAGAELVGNIGGRTAVMNNDQIVDSVSAGVYQAVLAALGGGNEDDGNTNIVINLDGEKIYENQQKIARGRGYNLGMGAFSFG